MTDFQKTARELVIKLHNCNEGTLVHPGYQWEVQVLTAALKAAFDAGRESYMLENQIVHIPTPPATVKDQWGDVHAPIEDEDDEQ